MGQVEVNCRRVAEVKDPRLLCRGVVAKKGEERGPTTLCAHSLHPPYHGHQLLSALRKKGLDPASESLAKPFGLFFHADCEGWVREEQVTASCTQSQTAASKLC